MPIWIQDNLALISRAIYLEKHEYKTHINPKPKYICFDIDLKIIQV